MVSVVIYEFAYQGADSPSRRRAPGPRTGPAAPQLSRRRRSCPFILGRTGIGTTPGPGASGQVASVPWPDAV